MIVIPDVHGHADLFQAAVDAHPGETFALLGDLVNRGAQSVRCLEIARDLRRAGRLDALVVGNHDLLLLDALSGNEAAVSVLRRVSDHTPLTAGLHPLELAGLAMEVYTPAVPWFPTVVNGQRAVLVHANLPPLDSHGNITTTTSEEHFWNPVFRSRPLPAGVSVTVHGHSPLKYNADPYVRPDLIMLDNVSIYDGDRPGKPRKLNLLDTRTGVVSPVHS